MEENRDTERPPRLGLSATPGIYHLGARGSATKFVKQTKHFSELPTEIRLQIWQLAIPKSRVLRIASSSDRSHLKRIYPMQPLPIPTILHVNRESRSVGLDIFRLGFGPDGSPCNPEDNDYWNPSADTLYLPSFQPPRDWDVRQSREFMEPIHDPNFWASRDDSHIGSTELHIRLAALRHLALPWNYKVIHGLGLKKLHFSKNYVAWLPRWLFGFNELRSVSFLIDHWPKWYRTGEIVLYEPEETVMDQGQKTETRATAFRATPSEVEGRIEKIMDMFREQEEPEWDVPSIEILVMGHRKTKKRSGFCLPLSQV